MATVKMAVGEPGSAGRVVRFKSKGGETLLEIRTDNTVDLVEVSDVDGPALFRIDAAGDVRVGGQDGQ